MGKDLVLCPLVEEIINLNLSLTLKLKTTSLFDIAIRFGIGVNEKGLTRVTPFSFSKEKRNKKYSLLMKVVPNYKLPSFRLGIMEVVTTVAHAAVASNSVTKISQFKKTPLLRVAVDSIAPGRTGIHNTSFNTAFSQPAVIGRMVYEIKCVTKHLQSFLNRFIEMTNLCAVEL